MADHGEYCNPDDHNEQARNWKTSAPKEPQGYTSSGHQMNSPESQDATNWTSYGVKVP